MEGGRLMVDGGGLMVEEGFVLYCLPGKAWVMGFSYPGTSSRVTYAPLVASSRRYTSLIKRDDAICNVSKLLSHHNSSDSISLTRSNYWTNIEVTCRLAPL